MILGKMSYLNFSYILGIDMAFDVCAILEKNIAEKGTTRYFLLYL